MKAGDLVKYYGSWNGLGLVLGRPDESGTVKIYHNGDIKWWVTNGLKVVNESR